MTTRDEVLEKMREAFDQLETAARVGRHREAFEDLLNLGASFQQSGAWFAVEMVLTEVDRLAARYPLAEEQSIWRLNLRGLSDLARGRPEAAREEFRSMLTLAERLSEQHAVATALMNLGNVEWSSREFDRAISLFQRSREERRPEDVRERLQIALNMAGIQVELGNLSEAELLADEVARSEVAAKDLHLRSSLTGVRGLVAAHRGDRATAADLFRKSAADARRAGDFSHAIAALQNLAVASLDLGQTGVALRALRRAERFALYTGSFGSLDAIQRTLATALHQAGRDLEAVRELERARESALERQDPDAEARIAGDIGALAIMRGRPLDAVAPLRGALETFKATGDTEWTLRAAANLAEAHILLDDFEAATRVLVYAANLARLNPGKRADLWESVGDSVLDAKKHVEAGRLYRTASTYAVRFGGSSPPDQIARMASKLAAVGESSPAVALYNRALRTWTAQAELPVYQILNDRGIERARLGSVQAGLSDLRKSLEAASDADDRPMQALVIGNMSELTRQLRRADEAAELAQRAVELARETGNRIQEAEALTTLGLAQQQMGLFANSADAFDSALRIARSESASALEATALGGLAGVAFFYHRWRHSLRLYEQALMLERHGGDFVHETETLAALIETSAALRDSRRWRTHARRLVRLVQQGGGPLETALDGLERSGSRWLLTNELGLAAEAYSTGILLAIAMLPAKPNRVWVRLVGRQLAAPFVHARLQRFPDEDALERTLRRRLRRPLGEIWDLVSDWLGSAREAAAKTTRD